jgi:hypothetical protein
MPSGTMQERLKHTFVAPTFETPTIVDAWGGL